MHSNMTRVFFRGKEASGEKVKCSHAYLRKHTYLKIIVLECEVEETEKKRFTSETKSTVILAYLRNFHGKLTKRRLNLHRDHLGTVDVYTGSLHGVHLELFVFLPNCQFTSVFTDAKISTKFVAFKTLSKLLYKSTEALSSLFC